MPTYTVKARRTGALADISVNAPTREEAIQQVVAGSGPGESTEVFSAVETAPDDVAGPTGTSAKK